MDYSNIDNELGEWKGEDYYVEKNTHLDISHSLWDGNQNEHLSYMFDETTPIKACGDLAYNVFDSGKHVNKDDDEEFQESSSQVKRRRMLQFNSSNNVNAADDDDSFLCNETMELGSTVVKSKDKLDLIEDENLQWGSTFYGGRSVSGNVGLDQSSEAWLSNCFSDGGMDFNAEDMNVSGFFDDQIDVSEFCNMTPETESDTVEVCPTPPPRRVYKGRKSFIRAPTNLASSVAYPFALIKPCGVHGDVTLKDINQRIRSPPSTRSKKDDIDDNPSASYPTSAFSGKPVVVKTKIRTEGGKGSITIMRTKG